MQDNPYVRIIDMMREEGCAFNPPAIMLAEVITPPPELLIKVGDIQIGTPNLLIADYLLNDYQRIMQMATTSSNGTTNEVFVGEPYCHSHELTTLGFEPGTVKTIDTLKAGDVLAVMPTYDEQTYIILAKVVRI